MKKSIVSLSLLFVFILSSMMLSGFAFDSGKGSGFDGESSFENSSFREEKSFSKATLEDDFADDRIIVVMNKQETMRFKDYSVSDFSRVGGISKVEELTKSSSEMLQEQMSKRQTSSIANSHDLQTEEQQKELNTMEIKRK